MAEQGRTTLDGYFETGDVPTESQFRDLIDSYLNKTDESDQIVPAPTAGDAGKFSRIKSDESGWEIFEKFDKPTFLQEATVEEENSGTHVSWRLGSSEAESEDFIFTQGAFDVNPSFTRKNVVWAWGYNHLADGTRVNASQAGLAWRMETFYEISGTPNFEAHLQHISPNGTITRPFYSIFAQDESDNRLVGFDVDQFKITHTYDDGQGGRVTDNILLVKKSNSLAQWKYGHLINTPAVTALSQINAAGNGLIELIGSTSDDHIKIGGGVGHSGWLQVPNIIGRLSIGHPSDSEQRIHFVSNSGAAIEVDTDNVLTFRANGKNFMVMNNFGQIDVREPMRFRKPIAFNPAPISTTAKVESGNFIEISRNGNTAYIKEYVNA